MVQQQATDETINSLQNYDILGNAKYRALMTSHLFRSNVSGTRGGVGWGGCWSDTPWES